MIDLGGTMPPGHEEAARLWGSCAGQPAARSHLWRFPAARGDDLLREQLGRLLGLDPSALTITASVRAAALRQGLVAPALGSAAAFQNRLSERTGELPRFAGPHGIMPLAPGADERQALRQLEDQGFLLSPGEDFFCPRPALRAAFLRVSAAAAERFADAVATCGLFAPDAVSEAQW